MSNLSRLRDPATSADSRTISLWLSFNSTLSPSASFPSSVPLVSTAALLLLSIFFTSSARVDFVVPSMMLLLLDKECACLSRSLNCSQLAMSTSSLKSTLPSPLFSLSLFLLSQESTQHKLIPFYINRKDAHKDSTLTSTRLISPCKCRNEDTPNDESNNEKPHRLQLTTTIRV